MSAGTTAPLADLFPGFDAREITAENTDVYLRTGGEGPPLLLLHGYPQMHAMWHKVAPALAEHFTVVIPDLPGYGRTSVPATVPDHSTFSKRAMAKVMVATMAALGHERFHLAGHDRGGRVAYRLALDHPDVLDKVAVLDIVPTYAMWHEFTVKLAMKTYHWLFLAQPEPLPEMLINKAPVAYLDYTIASWTKAKSLEAFDPRALDHYRAFFSQSDRVHACCEDYRAGQTYDLAADEADVAAGNRIAAPLLALWGAAGIPGETREPLDIWRNWADDVTGVGIDSGHFVCEENPEATTKALLDFFQGTA